MRKQMTAALAIVATVSVHAVAADKDYWPKKDAGSPSEKSFKQNYEGYTQEKARKDKDEAREAMRDKTHDGMLRHKTGPDSSVGVDIDAKGGGVSGKKTFP